MQGVIYTRVSSDEQVKGTSLESQEELCRKYCQEKSITVLAVFREEGASAKTADRAELLRSLDYCRKHKGQVHAFVVAKVDRFARNTEDHFYVRKLLLEYGATLHSVTEPIGNSPTEKFVETVLAASSEFDNAVRKQRCTDGMIARLNQGVWPWKPPAGYRCLQTRKRGEKKTQADPPDPSTFPLIQRALKEYAKGVMHSQAELARLLDSWGLARVRGKKTRPQFVDRLLGTYLKFYAGILVNPWTGEEHSGLQIPMITREEFFWIKLVRSGKARIVRRDRHNPLFPLRRTVLCSSCRRPLTGSSSRGNGGRYPYYHCSHRECGLYGKAMSKDVLESAFLRYLDRVTPRPKYLRLFEAIVLDVSQEMKRMSGDYTQTRSKRIADLEVKRKRIFEMREDSSYSKEVFRERLAEVDDEIAAAKYCLSEYTIAELDAAALTYATKIMGNLRGEWLNLAPALRPRFQKLVLPAGIPFDRDRGYGTADLGLLLELNRRCRGQRSQLVDLVRVSWNRILEQLKEILALATDSSTIGSHGTTGGGDDKASRLAA